MLKRIAETFNLRIDYLPDPNINILNLGWGKFIPIDISNQACQQFGFKHGDKIVDTTRHNPDYKYPDIVIGVAYGTDLNSKQIEVLWVKSTHPSSQGQYFYIQPKNIKNYKKMS